MVRLRQQVLWVSTATLRPGRTSEPMGTRPPTVVHQYQLLPASTAILH
jgi:hypothetical protein